MIDGSLVKLYVPNRVKIVWPEGVIPPLPRMWDRVAAAMGGGITDYHDLAELPEPFIPAIGFSPNARPLIDQWSAQGRTWLYWDQGYVGRQGGRTALLPGRGTGMHRWHVGRTYMDRIMPVKSDRWDVLGQPVAPWRRGGRHIVLAEPTAAYSRFVGLPDGWADATAERLRGLTDRPIVRRGKGSERSFADDLAGAHALVTHGSNAAVEAAIMGCPVFVAPECAAALIGRTDLSAIETPAYPDREPWLWSLAYCQFSEAEMIDGTMWGLLQ